MEPPAIDLGDFAEKHQPRKRAALVEECLRFDVADLRRIAAFRHGAGGKLSWMLGQAEIAAARYAFISQGAGAGELAIELQRGAELRRTRLVLTTTVPHFGGARFWFRCPHCGRRGRTLFATDRKLEPACRRCHGLQYRSAQTHDARVDELRKDAPKMAAMLFDNSGTLWARLRRVQLVAKAMTAIEREQAKQIPSRRK